MGRRVTAGAYPAVLALSLLAALLGSARADGEKCFVSVASDDIGWLNFSGGRLQGGKGNTGSRFSLARAPDGTQAVQHTIRRGQTIDPLGADSAILYNGPTSAIRLSYRQWTEEGKGRGHGGKAMSVMGGRGQAGGHYESGPRGNRINHGEGWSYYLLTPVTEGRDGTTSARNGLRGAIGAANRGDLGASCVAPSSNRPGGDPTRGDRRRCFELLHGTSHTLPTGQWQDIEMTVVMNDPGVANGSASYSINGRTVHTQRGVMWARTPEETSEVWIRWRMMYGGTSGDLPPPQDLREWYRDFNLEVIPRSTSGTTNAGSTADSTRERCVPPATSAVVARGDIGDTSEPSSLVPEPDAGAGNEDTIASLPFTPDYPTARTECAIWLCLPAGFLPSECDKPLKKMTKRILKGKSPLPSWGSCFTDEDSGGSRARLVQGIAAYIADDTYLDGIPCVRITSDSAVPKDCLGTARSATMYDDNGKQVGDTHYYFTLEPTDIVIARREIEQCDDDLEYGHPDRCQGRLVYED